MAVDLAALLPVYFQDITEFQEIMSAENTALELLEKSINQVRDNNYIQTCDEKTVELYEQLLNIYSLPGENLEYRKNVILGRLLRRLPYTLPKLRELLDAAVGRDAYEIYIRNQSYELELNIINQVYQVLLDLKTTVQEMIPAHLLFIFAGRYPVSAPVDIQLSNRLELQSDYHARYNRQYLVLDGTWLLDGTYKLNGYKELAEIDLYPLVFTVAGGCQVKPGISSSETCRSYIDVPVKSKSGIEIATNVLQPIAVKTENRLQAEVGVEPAMNFALTVEKDLWYLDGTYLLDGTKLLDAEIIRYE